MGGFREHTILILVLIRERRIKATPAVAAAAAAATVTSPAALAAAAAATPAMVTAGEAATLVTKTMVATTSQEDGKEKEGQSQMQTIHREPAGQEEKGERKGGARGCLLPLVWDHNPNRVGYAQPDHDPGDSGRQQRERNRGRESAMGVFSLCVFMFLGWEDAPGGSTRTYSASVS